MSTGCRDPSATKPPRPATVFTSVSGAHADREVGFLSASTAVAHQGRPHLAHQQALLRARPRLHRPGHHLAEGRAGTCNKRRTHALRLRSFIILFLFIHLELRGVSPRPHLPPSYPPPRAPSHVLPIPRAGGTSRCCKPSFAHKMLVLTAPPTRHTHAHARACFPSSSTAYN